MLPDLEIGARLILATLLSGIIGLERERGERAAGLRTHALVGLGSCLLMIVSAFGFEDWHYSPGALDPSRIAAQVVSGIGFLGAGVIILRTTI
jgi:putative Mg2+ transporter-C (MgtC) family protein